VTLARPRALFVFAHQDDEYSAAPWILEELANGSDVRCVFLTDGGARVDPAVRDAESREALQSLGVSLDNVAMLADDRGRIGDGELPARCAGGLAMLERWIGVARFEPQRIYAPAYEGGHPDHDAAHVIAANLAAKLGILEEAWQFALYNAYRCSRPFFTMLRQLPTTSPSRRAQMPFSRRWSLAFLCRRYRSQQRTWLGLFPGAFLERVVLQRESVVRFDASKLGRRPHDGALLYERMFGTTYDEFAARVAGLLPG
jgi:LmbE family N-acetylglucosaminyl deacetylase